MPREYYTVEKIGPGLMVRLTDRVTMMNFTETLEAIEKHANREGAKLVCVNLSGLVTVYSSAIGRLAAWQKNLQRSGGQLFVCDLTEMARKVFDLAGIASSVSVADSEEDVRTAWE